MRKKTYFRLLSFFMTLILCFSSTVTIFAEESTQLSTEILTEQDENVVNYDAKSPITYAEFVKMASKLFHYDKQPKVQLGKITLQDWFAKNISALATEKPDETLTRQDAAVMIAKILKCNLTDSEKTKFKDDGQIEDYAKACINALTSKGYLNGYADGTFRPQNLITFGETTNLLNTVSGTVYEKAGTYDQNGQTIKGNLSIVSPGVELKNAVIEGDLYISEGVGTGEVTLNHVTVKGETIVSGGGMNSILFVDTQLGTLRVEVPDNTPVRVVASGSTSINMTEVRSETKLQTDTLTGDGFQGIVIAVPSIARVSLEGNFPSVIVDSPNAKVDILGGKAENIVITEKAVEAKVNLSSTTTVSSMEINAQATVGGTGKLESVSVTSQNVSIAQKPTIVNVADNITATVNNNVFNTGVHNTNKGNSSSHSPNNSSVPPTVNDSENSSGDTSLILNGPENVTVYAGEKAIFKVDVTSSSNLRYQWYRNNIEIKGATSNSYSFIAALSDNGSKFTVKVWIDGRETTSKTAVLTVQSKALDSKEKVLLAKSSEGTADDASITGLEIGQRYYIIQYKDNQSYVVRKDGTLGAALTGEILYDNLESIETDTIINLVNNETYKVVKVLEQEREALNYSYVELSQTPDSIFVDMMFDEPIEFFVNGKNPSTLDNIFVYRSGSVSDAIHTVTISDDKKEIQFFISQKGNSNDYQIYLNDNAKKENWRLKNINADNEYKAIKDIFLSFTVDDFANPPFTVNGPNDVFVTAGEKAVFLADAQPASGLSYQWYCNGKEISGATADSYSFTPGLSDSGAKFSVKVWAEKPGKVREPVFSKTAFLTVESQKDSLVILEEGSEGTAGDACITDLEIGQRYYIISYKDNKSYAVKADGTLGAEGTTFDYDALESLETTTITGLTNSERYKVVKVEEPERPSLTVILEEGSEGIAGDECVTGLEIGQRYYIISYKDNKSYPIMKDGTLGSETTETIYNNIEPLETTKIIGLINEEKYNVIKVLPDTPVLQSLNIFGLTNTLDFRGYVPKTIDGQVSIKTTKLKLNMESTVADSVITVSYYLLNNEEEETATLASDNSCEIDLGYAMNAEVTITVASKDDPENKTIYKLNVTRAADIIVTRSSAGTTHSVSVDLARPSGIYYYIKYMKPTETFDGIDCKKNGETIAFNKDEHYTETLDYDGVIYIRVTEDFTNTIARGDSLEFTFHFSGGTVSQKVCKVNITLPPTTTDIPTYKIKFGEPELIPKETNRGWLNIFVPVTKDTGEAVDDDIKQLIESVDVKLYHDNTYLISSNEYSIYTHDGQKGIFVACSLPMPSLNYQLTKGVPNNYKVTITYKEASGNTTLEKTFAPEMQAIPEGEALQGTIEFYKKDDKSVKLVPSKVSENTFTLNLTNENTPFESKYTKGQQETVFFKHAELENITLTDDSGQTLYVVSDENPELIYMLSCINSVPKLFLYDYTGEATVTGDFVTKQAVSIKHSGNLGYQFIFEYTVGTDSFSPTTEEELKEKSLDTGNIRLKIGTKEDGTAIEKTMKELLSLNSKNNVQSLYFDSVRELIAAFGINPLKDTINSNIVCSAELSGAFSKFKLSDSSGNFYSKAGSLTEITIKDKNSDESIKITPTSQEMQEIVIPFTEAAILTSSTANYECVVYDEDAVLVSETGLTMTPGKSTPIAVVVSTGGTAPKVYKFNITYEPQDIVTPASNKLVAASKPVVEVSGGSSAPSKPDVENTSKPDDDDLNKPSDEVSSKPDDEVSNEPADEDLSKPDDEDSSKPSDDDTNEPSDDDTNEPADDDASEPDDEDSNEPADDDLSEPDDEDSNEPADDDLSKPDDEVSSKPDDEVSNEPSDEGSNKPDDEVSSEPADEVSSKPDDDDTNEPADEDSSKPDDDDASEPADDDTASDSSVETTSSETSNETTNEA